MLWRRCLLSMVALAVSAGVACLFAVVLSSTSSTPPVETAIALPSNDARITAIGADRPVKVPRDNDTDGLSSEERVKERNEEGDRGVGGKEACLPCPSLFGKLELTKHGNTVQEVRLQVRGEPKSGTSFMFEWAINSLALTCRFLEQLYGKGSCSLGWNRTENRSFKPRKIGKASVVEMKVVTMNFEPKGHGVHRKRPQSEPAACTCEGVDRVVVEISHLFKHNLPVGLECSWQHLDGVASEGAGCSHVGGHRVQNYTDVLGCMKESPCRLTDDRIQMLVLRDPRAVVVSSYFWLVVHPMQLTPKEKTLEHYVLRMLPTICQYVHLRYVVLHEEMSERMEEFEYEDSVANPLEWHRRWLAFVGLNLPESVVWEASDKDSKRQYSFAAKGVDKHPGGGVASPSRSFRDEVSEEVASEMDRIARIWLPPNLLDMFGIPLQ